LESIPGLLKSLKIPSLITEYFLDIFYKKKERREHSLNRSFYSDYIGLDHRPELRALVGKREKVFAKQSRRPVMIFLLLELALPLPLS
jgi:hypothetical protein